MRKFSKWIRKKFKSIHDTLDDSKSSPPALPPPLPVLPRKRQHVLTPSSSRENLLRNAVAKSAFFQRLPLELRRQIYIAAFGGRTVHMDLLLTTYPHLPSPRHARLDPRRGVRDRTALAHWRWWCRVCNRNPVRECCMGTCQLDHDENITNFWIPRVVPKKCFLGVMGWLLTCRQA